MQSSSLTNINAGGLANGGVHCGSKRNLSATNAHPQEKMPRINGLPLRSAVVVSPLALPWTKHSALPAPNKGRWKKEEHDLFLEALDQYGKHWQKISSHIKTRTVQQCKKHVYCRQKVVTVTACKSVRADGKRKSSILPRPTTNKRASLQTHVKTRTVQQCQAHVYCHQKVVTVTACKSVRADGKRNAVVRLNKRAPLQTQNLSKQYESDFSVMPLSQSKALMSLLECFRALIDAKASDDALGVAMQQCYEVDLEQRHLLWYIRLRQYQDHPIEKSKADKHTRFIRNHLSRCSPRQWLFARRVGIHEKKTTTAPKLSFPDFMEKLGLTN